MSSKWHLSRRTALRGLGAAVTLPMMNAMTASKLLGAAPAAELPKRMAFLFVPNGVDLSHWTPEKEGFGYDLPSILEPLENVRYDVSVLSGLTHDKGRANGDGAGDHARSASVFLTGSQPRKTSGGNIRSGVSVDQVAAEHFGSTTKFASIELGCEGGGSTGSCDSGYSCAYSNNISWASKTTPMAKEVNPRAVFERLFGDGTKAGNKASAERITLQRSLLDFVSDDAQRLQRRLGKQDKRKLDEYLTSVRSIEKRIESAEQDKELGEEVVSFEKPEGIPKDFGEHIRLMADMMVLAFQTDQTRVATCMFGRAGSNRSYKMVDVPDGHHQLSHHGNNPEKLEKIRRINRFHVQQLAYFIERLKSIPEGDGTLLDQSMIVYGSGLSDGNRHNNENLPVLLAGRGGQSIVPGRHIRFQEETPMTNLYMAMLERIGVSIPYLGDSTGSLSGLS